MVHVCVAGFKGFNFLPQVKESVQKSHPVLVHPNTTYNLIFDSSELLGYCAGKAEIPVIIDTGASVPLTPVITDLVGNIEHIDLDSLQGLSSKSKVFGQDTVK